MLYLHCGWARTSTTSLQAALFDSREELAEAGVVYPEKWLTHERSPHHHGVADLLRDSQRSARPLEELKAFLDCHSDRDVILSVEQISIWLLRDGHPSVLRDFLIAVGEAMPVTCVWTLRRVDDGRQSFYLWRLTYGATHPPPDWRSAGAGDVDRLFAGMAAAAESATGSTYVRYDRGGAHNEELLRALGVPPQLQPSILERIGRNRLNASLTHKQAVALIELDALSARAGVELDWRALRDRFLSGEVRFQDDRRCVVMDGEAARIVHGQALAAARAQGFAPYLKLFADEEIEDSAPVSLDPDVITDEDLELLVSVAAPSAPRASAG